MTAEHVDDFKGQGGWPIHPPRRMGGFTMINHRQPLADHSLLAWTGIIEAPPFAVAKDGPPSQKGGMGKRSSARAELAHGDDVRDTG
jgi:hypothetical protein